MMLIAGHNRFQQIVKAVGAFQIERRRQQLRKDIRYEVQGRSSKEDHGLAVILNFNSVTSQQCRGFLNRGSVEFAFRFDHFVSCRPHHQHLTNALLNFSYRPVPVFRFKCRKIECGRKAESGQRMEPAIESTVVIHTVAKIIGVHTLLQIRSGRLSNGESIHRIVLRAVERQQQFSVVTDCRLGGPSRRVKRHRNPSPRIQVRVTHKSRTIRLWNDCRKGSRR